MDKISKSKNKIIIRRKWLLCPPVVGGVTITTVWNQTEMIDNNLCLQMVRANPSTLHKWQLKLHLQSEIRIKSIFNPVVACNGSGPRQSDHALHQSGSLSHASQKEKKTLRLPVSELEQQIQADMKRLKAGDANLKARHSHLHRETSALTDVWRSASSRCRRDFITHLHV